MTDTQWMLLLIAMTAGAIIGGLLYYAGLL